MTPDVLSTSPDGRYQVITKPWDPRMSLWLYPPEIFDLKTKEVVFKVRDIAWSLNKSEWESNSIIRISLSNYPYIPPELGIIIRINCAYKTAKIGDDSEIELQVLHDALERTLASYKDKNTNFPV
jgi:hypothetical protein